MSNTLRRVMFAGFALSVAAPLFAQEACSLSLQKLLSSQSHTDYGKIAYIRTQLAADNSKREVFDPSQPEGQRWRLLLKDDTEPSVADQEAYQADRAAAQEGFKLEALLADIDWQEIEPLSTAQDSLTYSFKPTKLHSDDGSENEKMLAAISGKLTLHSGPRCEAQYELSSLQPFSPATGVKVKEFYLGITLRPVTSEQLFYPVRLSQRVKGKAFLVKKFDEQVEIEYFDHQRVMP